MNDKKELVKYIAFGAGQCSSVLPYILEEYDYIIFVDTGYEIPLTYEWTKIVQSHFHDKFIWIESHLDPTIHNLHPPLCTRSYKILPTRRKLRKMGVKKAISYFGITVDEKQREKESDVKWIKNEYPLLRLGWTRKDCQNFLLQKIGFVPPRSGCMCCKHFKNHHLIPGDKNEG